MTIVNDEDEQCEIDFSKSEERCNQRVRTVRRRPLTSSSLPSHWQSQSENCSRFALSELSEEYKTIKERFHQTMNTPYKEIVSIERIQNQRWYKQYDAHRVAMHERLKENTEKQLFHGCSGAAAESIIHECFNRGYAGVNGKRVRLAFGPPTTLFT